MSTSPSPNRDLTEILNRARRIAFGAAASLVEIIQDPQKRETNLQRMSAELSDLADELAVKGQQTEMEARRYVDRMIHPDRADVPPSQAVVSVEPQPISDPPLSEAANEINELTQQIHSLRDELERLRDPKSDE